MANNIGWRRYDREEVEAILYRIVDEREGDSEGRFRAGRFLSKLIIPDRF